ncbi:hypothetical protein Tsubulata_006670 [Turnera subulata]|uniref:Nodulin-like domain-containing protein n=1 Tax=Turnera subulata TaxID=218843 RepID=A0A9Q0GLU2_9ROSI|nr:hypothetical protein Tsubulata_006670 [Turnera subulata]
MEMMNTKWIATVASIWIQTCSGAYTFGIYSPVLKSSQGYDQSTLDLISVFKEVGGNAGVLAGVLYAFVTTGNSRLRLGCFSGPWVVIFAGAVQWFVGFFMMWASVVGLIPRLPVPVMCLFIGLAYHGQVFCNTTNLVTGVHNFRDYGGSILGILKGYFGLGGAILVQFYQIAWKGNPANFILLLALLPTAVWLSLMTLVRNYDNTSTKLDDKKHLNAISAVALITAAYLMIIILLENMFTLPSLARIISFAFLMLLAVSPLVIVIRAHKKDSSSFSQTLLIIEKDYQSNATSVVDSADYVKLPSEEGQSTRATIDNERYLSDEENMNIWQAFRSGNFWLLFIAMFCGLGTVTAVMDNLSQIGESLGYTTAEINSVISLTSIWNFLGRIGAGVVSDMCMHRYGWTRPIFIVVTLAVLVIGQIVIVIDFPKSLFLSSVLVGICDGSLWLLMTVIISELFGLQHMGIIFNTISIASPVGSYIFSVKVVGYFYDMVANSETHVCLGTRCFMLSLSITASITFCGALVALALFFRTKRVIYVNYRSRC